MNWPLSSYFSLTFPLEKCMKCYPKTLELGRIYGQWNHTAGPSAVAIANRSSAYSCECVKPDTPLRIYVDAKMKYSVSPYPDSCCCGLRHFLLTSDRSWVAEAMSCVTSSWRNESTSTVTCIFFSFALVETLLSCPSCAWREDRLILLSFRWKGFSGRTWLKVVVSWCFWMGAISKWRKGLCNNYQEGGPKTRGGALS